MSARPSSPDDVVIRLLFTEADLGRARQAGRARANRARDLGLRDAYGYAGSSVALHAQGALGELAVAEALGYPWEPLGHLPGDGKPDVGPYDVRSTTYPNGWLRIRPKDPDARATILVRLGRPWNVAVLAGWVVNRDGKIPRWYGDRFQTGRGDCWELPESTLRPMSQLLL